jgi:hypothetical protein
MADAITVKVEGLDAIRVELQALPAKLRKRALLAALRKGARPLRDYARTRTPVLKLSTHSGASALRSGKRRVGTVRKAISVRTSKLAARRGDVGVFINVRPLTKAQRAGGKWRGAVDPRDPFYWRWLEFGWNPAGRDRTAAGKRERRRLNDAGSIKAKPGAGFLRAAAARVMTALPIIERELRPAIAKLNQRRAPAP